MIVEFELPSVRGNERIVMQRVAESISSEAIPPERLEKLKTAVAEAAMNAIEHGNGGRAELPISVRLQASPQRISVRIADRGGYKELPSVEEPDIRAKLAGEQSHRGWGLFLIKNMVDEVNVSRDGDTRVVEIVLYLEGARVGHS
jgi:anti-sigma regulatory factor (Ser/Thr protein kinase)